MIDPTYMPILELLGVVAGIAPIAVLAGFAVLDLRAFMLVRAVAMLKRRQRSGIPVVSGEEWGPLPEGL